LVWTITRKKEDAVFKNEETKGEGPSCLEGTRRGKGGRTDQLLKAQPRWRGVYEAGPWKENGLGIHEGSEIMSLKGAGESLKKTEAPGKAE